MIEAPLENMGFELVDVECQTESGELILRLLIDREGGINLDSCAAVSREIGTLIEVEDVIKTAYRFEVSSPGIERPLKKEKDFARFAGQLVVVKTNDAVDPDSRGCERKTFRGELGGMKDGKVSVIQNDKQGGEVLFDLADIDKANLEVEF